MVLLVQQTPLLLLSLRRCRKASSTGSPRSSQPGSTELRAALAQAAQTTGTVQTSLSGPTPCSRPSPVLPCVLAAPRAAGAGLTLGRAGQGDVLVDHSLQQDIRTVFQVGQLWKGQKWY